MCCLILIEFADGLNFTLVMELHRHPCGFYFSQDFAVFLSEKQRAEAAQHAGEILALDYLRCREGAQAGQAWWQLDWVALHTVPADARYSLGDTEIALSVKTIHGLRHHLVHYADGQVVVKK
ncbi:hypothetical protein SAMN02745166_04144 [Prosthecobacter debontii]|uniref:Uncharacterized protein n=2 Tax=Prosthecobacter debontii TaxID=48467 RepID=A0A1T4YUK0_9BACT|nr:hypothetical protein SAMN02745166_04144 [Prosthecobacter debontii]